MKLPWSTLADEHCKRVGGAARWVAVGRSAGDPARTVCVGPVCDEGWHGVEPLRAGPPRLSVDIDLVFVDHRTDRETALHDIALELGNDLAGHNRPVHEVLFPAPKPLEPAFTNEFAGMTFREVGMKKLEHTQARLLEEPPRQLTAAHRQFLLPWSEAIPHGIRCR